MPPETGPVCVNFLRIPRRIDGLVTRSQRTLSSRTLNSSPPSRLLSPLLGDTIQLLLSSTIPLRALPCRGSTTESLFQLQLSALFLTAFPNSTNVSPTLDIFLFPTPLDDPISPTTSL
jgi:hypothetical protein